MKTSQEKHVKHHCAKDCATIIEPRGKRYDIVTRCTDMRCDAYVKDYNLPFPTEAIFAKLRTQHLSELEDHGGMS